MIVSHVDPKFSVAKNRITAIRLICSIVVVISHLDFVAGNSSDHFRKLGLFAVAIFFGLSGFLLTENLTRKGANRHFVVNRLLRIFPGFIVALIVTSFLFVPIYEQYVNSRSKYFITIQNFAYIFANITTNIQMIDINKSLQGAHVENWNAPLWTLRYELFCYFLLFLIFKLFPKASEKFFAILFMASAFIFLYSVSILSVENRHDIVDEYQYLFLITCFLSFFTLGGLIYLLNKRVRNIFLIISIFLLFFSLLFPPFAQSNYSSIRDFLIEISLIPIFLSLAFFQPVKAILKNDFSYGVYIYGFPVTQLIVGISPRIASNFASLTIVVLSATFFISWLSWNFIEKPFMQFKR